MAVQPPNVGHGQGGDHTPYNQSTTKKSIAERKKGFSLGSTISLLLQLLAIAIVIILAILIAKT